MQNNPLAGDYLSSAQQALQEWKSALNYYENVSEPDLVEYAIYNIEAARRKYEYLMKKLRGTDGSPAAAEGSEHA